MWQESFIDNKPHYDLPVNAETIGDYQETILAVAREMRQNRWSASRDPGFGFIQTQVELAAEVIEETAVTHWHLNHTINRTFQAGQVPYNNHCIWLARATLLSPPPPEEPNNQPMEPQRSRPTLDPQP